MSKVASFQASVPPERAVAEEVEEVSVIIPSRHGDVARLVESLASQTYRHFTVHVVSGLTPASRARNVGIAQARGDFFLFVDDDAVLGHAGVLESLVAALRADPTVGVVGSSKLLFPNATAFQRRVAREVPRWIYPAHKEAVKSSPPLDRYGFTGVTTTCCLVRREVVEMVGTFSEALVTGEDTEFFYRVHLAGYGFVIPARCWAYHNPPATVRSLLKKGFSYGIGHAHEARRDLERGMAIVPLNRWYGRVFLLLSPFFFLPSLFVQYYFDPRREFRFGFFPLKALSTYATLYGYAWGWRSFARSGRGE